MAPVRRWSLRIYFGSYRDAQRIDGKREGAADLQSLRSPAILTHMFLWLLGSGGLPTLVWADGRQSMTNSRLHGRVRARDTAGTARVRGHVAPGYLFAHYL